MKRADLKGDNIMPSSIKVPGLTLQEKPLIYLAVIAGDWLLSHTTPSWRIEDPEIGFQRVVKEKRAREIAVAVLDQKRTFPNAIVLATDIEKFTIQDHSLIMDNTTRFLVVDGQHRLWAQKFSGYVAPYACTIHCKLDEVAMAKLFLEINDNQKRVPSSLRWDLVRLVRPEDDLHAVGAAELVFALATNSNSPLYQRIDLTGEQSQITLKQGSLAPEIRNLISKKGPISNMAFESQYDLLVRYLAAIKSLDSNGWINAATPFYQARILRVLIRLLLDIIKHVSTEPSEMSVSDFREYLLRIDRESLNLDNIRAKQGGAGMKQIYDEIKEQVFEQAGV